MDGLSPEVEIELKLKPTLQNTKARYPEAKTISTYVQHSTCIFGPGQEKMVVIELKPALQNCNFGMVEKAENTYSSTTGVLGPRHSRGPKPPSCRSTEAKTNTLAPKPRRHDNFSSICQIWEIYYQFRVGGLKSVAPNRHWSEVKLKSAWFWVESRTPWVPPLSFVGQNPDFSSGIRNLVDFLVGVCLEDTSSKCQESGVWKTGILSSL